jgi:hypothetical protein
LLPQQHATMQDVVAAKRLEIKLRYKRRRKRVNLGALRLAELNRLLTSRYGDHLPDDDAGRDDLAVIVHHMVSIGTGNPVDRIRSWVRMRAPWCPIVLLDELTHDAMTRPRRWKADKLAWRMHLTAADRKTLRITTIGAIDKGKGTRVAERRQRKRELEEHRRRAAGAKPRAEYEAASTSTTKPWIAAGISRRTWYRRQSAPA